jgi:hypothetical protein
MDATQTTLQSVLEAAQYFRDTLIDLRALIDDAGYPNMPLAVTEANVSWDGDPANDVLTGSPGTFLAGLYVADMLGIGLEEGLWTHAFWSISEGWTLGFITEQGQVRPSYHALRMYAEHFGSNVVDVTSTPTGFDVYASRNDAEGQKKSLGSWGRHECNNPSRPPVCSLPQVDGYRRAAKNLCSSTAHSVASRPPATSKR